MKRWQSAQGIVAAAQLRAWVNSPGDIPPEARDWEKLDKTYDQAHADFLAAAQRKIK